jgi:transposase
MLASGAKLKQMRGMADLTDGQWEHLKPFVEWDQQQRQRPDRRGGRWSEARRVLNGVLWILRTGAPWHDLPARYGSYQTGHRRFQQWQRSGVLDGILWALCEDLRARGQLGLEETFIDASFMGAKKGAMVLVERSSAKGASSWQSQTAMVFLSPSGLRALRRMSKSSSPLRSRTVSWPRSRND